MTAMGEETAQARGGAGRGAPAERPDFFGALPRPSGVREFVVGLFVLAGVVAVLVTLFMLTDPGTFRGRYYLYAVVEDAGGIRNGDPVQLRGVHIGRVMGFEIVPRGVRMRLEIENRYRIPEDSRVRLRSNGLLGGMVADVEPGKAAALLKNGDTLPGERVEGVVEMMERVGTQAGQVLGRAETVLSDGTVRSLGEAASDLQRLVAELAATVAEQRGQWRELSRSLSRAAAGVERAVAGPALERAVARSDSITVLLEQTAVSLRRTSASLDVILGRMARGEGTLGLLSSDDALYRSLAGSLESLRLLLEDIRANPRRYIRLEIF